MYFPLILREREGKKPNISHLINFLVLRDTRLKRNLLGYILHDMVVANGSLFYFHHNSTWFLLSRLVFYFIFTKAESQDDIRGNEFAPKRHYKGNSKLKCELRILKLLRLVSY